MNEKRQGLLQRLKISEKEKEALEGKKDEAELFLSKQVRAWSPGMSQGGA